MEAVNGSCIDWGAASSVFPGQTECGDRLLVKDLSYGALVAVIDGLGHGSEAAAAANTAIATLDESCEQIAGGKHSLLSLLMSCNERLQKTRGAVMSLAIFNALDGTMTWTGVGNVEGVLLRADRSANPRQEYLLLRGGVIGTRLPALQAAIMPVMRGDTLIFATDGIRNGFEQNLVLDDSPQRIADHILARHISGGDDALALVARYVGGRFERKEA
ncbi:MAG: SpoIIE family protein phosphatase [Deltaproteobacteria bacterium]|nr:SpoIIE family protein phosphatase [Deltaproteobacteria bacterium]